MATLEDQLEGAFVDLDVSSENRESVRTHLNLLRGKDEPTYEHSIRVGLLASRIARHMHLDPKALLFAGTLHDVGKTLIPPETLEKTEGFDEQDRAKMRKHPEYTYQMLRGVHEFSAEVALRHHRYQEDGYPKRLPKASTPFSANTQLMIDFFGRILSLADFYDAVTSRVNEKFGEKRKLSQEEVRSILLMKNQDQRHLIQDLYANGIFGEQEETPDGKTPDSHDFLYDSLWKGWDGTRNPRETRRYVTLACSLEPLSDKIGCTTRGTDLNPYQKLEYFITGAVNIGDAFEDLTRRVLESDGQPALIYDTAYQAQADCKKNRAGGRVNQGIIEMLVPIVTAQMLFDPNYKASPEEVLRRSKEVMQDTTSEDVQELVKMKRLAYDLSGYHDREVPEYPEAGNVYAYYTADLQHSEKPTSIKHNEEFVLGFPTVRKIHDFIMASRRRGFNRKVEDAYTELRRTDHIEAASGLTADCTACGIYLVLSHHPKDKVVR